MDQSQEGMDRRGFVMWGAAAALATGCAARGQDPAEPKPAPQDPATREGSGERAQREDDPRTQLADAICWLIPASGSSVSGWVRFKRGERRQVTVTAEISGLTPSGKHAIHVHEFGDLRAADGTATGGHYNPEGHEHGLPDKAERHAGDFGNLQADESGKATLKLELDQITINGRRNPVLGRAIIVHAKPDDGGQPTGNAGGRIAQGVIGATNAAWKPA